MHLHGMAVLGSAYLSLLGRLLCVQVCIVLVCKGLGLHQEVPQVGILDRVPALRGARAKPTQAAGTLTEGGAAR